MSSKLKFFLVAAISICSLERAFAIDSQRKNIVIPEVGRGWIADERLECGKDGLPSKVEVLSVLPNNVRETFRLSFDYKADQRGIVMKIEEGRDSGCRYLIEIGRTLASFRPYYSIRAIDNTSGKFCPGKFRDEFTVSVNSEDTGSFLDYGPLNYTCAVNGKDASILREYYARPLGQPGQYPPQLSVGFIDWFMSLFQK